MHSVSGKTIAITGSASGIGLETSKYLAAQGAKVSIADLSENALKQVASDIEKAGGKVIATVVDVRDQKQVEAWIKKTVDTFGKLDGGVNVAGVNSRQHSEANTEDIEDDDFDFVQAVNVKGVLNCMRAEIPHMNSAGGSIVNLASIAGLIGMPKFGAYTASKFAVVGLTKTAAKELGPRNIRCNCICPGYIDTPMLRGAAEKLGTTVESWSSLSPLGRLGTPRDIAHLVEWLLSDGSAYISGTSQRIDGALIDY